MTPPQQQPTPEEMRTVFRRMQVQMRNCAMHHIKEVKLRTLVMLQDLDLLSKPVQTIGKDLDLAVISDSSHPRRIKLPFGPLLLYQTEGEKSQRVFVELPLYLYSELPEVRKAVVTFLDHTLVNQDLGLSPRTRDTWEQARPDLLSEDAHKWRQAAVKVNDALQDDLLVALQGLRQNLACEPAVKEILDTYAPRVIHPTISSLDSIVLDPPNPETNHGRLTEIVQEAVSNGKSLGDACARYYAKLGYLPLAPAYSMCEVVSRWMKTHPDDNAWTEVWVWAHAAFGPVPNYHACNVFVLRPDLIPDGKLPELWKEILSIVHDYGKKEDLSPNYEPWNLRRELTRHYMWHMEAHLPDTDGAPISSFAWWFTEQVASLFPNNPKSLKYYRTNWVEASTETIRGVYSCANPRIGRSYLRYMTVSVHSPWATSLFAVMGDRFDLLALDRQSEPVRVDFHNALVSNLLFFLPFTSATPADPTFAMECSLTDTITKWLPTQPEGQRKSVEQLITFSNNVKSVEGLCKALKAISNASLPDQIAITISAMAKAYTDPALPAAVWEVVSDKEWRRKVFLNVEERVFHFLMGALNIVQVTGQDKWFSLYPHYLAELCEEATDKDRRSFLFTYTVHACLTSDTVSAVRRLLRGDKRADFVELADAYRQRVMVMWANYPPWVQARMRGMLASLHVV